MLKMLQLLLHAARFDPCTDERRCAPVRVRLRRYATVPRSPAMKRTRDRRAELKAQNQGTIALRWRRGYILFMAGAGHSRFVAIVVDDDLIAQCPAAPRSHHLHHRPWRRPYAGTHAARTRWSSCKGQS
jgi:hypothetical protein